MLSELSCASRGGIGVEHIAVSLDQQVEVTGLFRTVELLPSLYDRLLHSPVHSLGKTIVNSAAVELKLKLLLDHLMLSRGRTAQRRDW